tara:strand:- start:265 stop:471 length:207 start_codon:yes stop_codon:yes gene_type:complete
MIYNKEVYGIEDSTIVDIEVVAGGVLSITTDAPRTCCVSIVKLDENSLDELITALIEAKSLINQGDSK